MRQGVPPPLGSRSPRRRRAFTLIEMMIVVSIIAILASVAIPKFADMILKAKEGSTKGNLGAIRSALSIYYSDNSGTYPNCAFGPDSTVFSDMVPSYLSTVGLIQTGIHPPVNTVYCDSVLTSGAVHDGQGWYYDGDATDSLFGNVYVACDHTDTRGSYWTSY